MEVISLASGMSDLGQLGHPGTMNRNTMTFQGAHGSNGLESA